MSGPSPTDANGSFGESDPRSCESRLTDGWLRSDSQIDTQLHDLHIGHSHSSERAEVVVGPLYSLPIGQMAVFNVGFIKYWRERSTVYEGVVCVLPGNGAVRSHEEPWTCHDISYC